MRSASLLVSIALLMACESQQTATTVPEEVPLHSDVLETEQAQEPQVPCGADNPEACLFTAWAHTTGRSRPVDLAMAASFYQRGCQLDQPSACLGLADLARKGEGGLRLDRGAAVRLQSRACELGSSFACRQVAEAHHHGLGAEQSKTQASQYLAHACQLGDPIACEAGPDVFEADLEEERREPIRAGIRDRLPDLRACYERVATARSGLRGRVVLNFEVACDGLVGHLELVESTFGGGQEDFIATCVGRVVRDWEFSPPEGGIAVEFRYPFTFGPM